MALRVYLLSVEELNDKEGAETLRQQALEKLDRHRREKAEHLKNDTARKLSIGAGLLLQLAIREMNEPAGAGQNTDKSGETVIMRVSQVLARLKEPIEISYCRGPKGKPDFQNVKDSLGVPWHFNLSHSGELVLCALSDAEIGADIQQMRPLKNLRLAERFFPAKEAERILRAGNLERQAQLFYQFWVRKESYGKLTGEGIAAVIGRDLADLEREVFWEESADVAGYQIALCRYRMERQFRPENRAQDAEDERCLE